MNSFNLGNNWFNSLIPDELGMMTLSLYWVIASILFISSSLSFKRFALLPFCCNRFRVASMNAAASLSFSVPSKKMTLSFPKSSVVSRDVSANWYDLGGLMA